MKWTMIVTGALMAACAAPRGPDPASPAGGAPVDFPAWLEERIARLGSEDLSARDSATSELRRVKAMFDDRISRAMRAEDPEVRLRAAGIAEPPRPFEVRFVP